MKSLTRIIVLFFCCMSVAAYSQNIAVIDYPTAFILHPLMTNYSFSHNAFEKAPLLSGEKEYDQWLVKVSGEISQLQTKYEPDIQAAQSNVDRIRQVLNRTADRNHTTISSLAKSFDRLRSSDKPEDKARLSKVDYGAQIKEAEERASKELAAARTKLKEAETALKALKQAVESPRYTTDEETTIMFARIEKEIIDAAKGAMQAKNCSVLLNRSGMGQPASNKPIHSLDPGYLAQTSDQELELYKRLLTQSPEPPPQDAPNQEYLDQLRQNFLRNRVGSIRRTVHARSGLRLVEPDIFPRVLLGGVSVTIDAVNYLLFHYGVEETTRELIAQVLREMGEE